MPDTVWFMTPMGLYGVREARGGITEILFGGPGRTPDAPESFSPLQREAAAQIGGYLGGARRDLGFPFLEAGTAFQKRVWAALRRIPYGETRSYREIAREIGSPRGARAVGLACGRNPLPLLTPCHRVLGVGGAPAGYRGGIERKLALLALEQGRA